MRRKDREITNFDEILGIIQQCDVCRLAFYDEKYPYIIPMNFGYTNDGTKLELYFHCAKEGRKLELLNSNPMVAFEMDCSNRFIPGDTACNSTMEFESICGNGLLEILPENEREYGLIQIMQQYSKKDTFHFDSKEIQAVTLLRLKVHKITGKRLKRS